ncbi:MAG TPA: LD-carboxypeptidase [Thermoanaerobaculia bacterium]
MRDEFGSAPHSSFRLTPPRALRPGAHIGVLAISSPSKPDRIEVAQRNLERLGYRVTLAENIYDIERRYLAGPDEKRLHEINRFVRSDEIDAFFFARGGYGAMRILDRIDYDAIRRNPRPIVGYSDLTALHQAVATRAGVSAFHGPMLNTDFYENLPHDLDAWFWAMLRGEAPLTWRFIPPQVVAEGMASGVLFGGCLSVTLALLGTPYDYWVDDGIWFWEEVSEPTYRIDRMLTHLKLTGRLNRIRAVMVGTLKECGESAPQEVDQLVDEFFANSGIPVIRNLPFGHGSANLLLPLGAIAHISTLDGTITFSEPVVTLG